MNKQIAALDRAIARHGQTVILSREGAEETGYEAEIPAWVRGANAVQLTESTRQQDRNVIISPTDLEAAQWPDVLAESRVPRNGDRVFIDGAWCRVEQAEGLFGPGGLIRVNLVVRG